MILTFWNFGTFIDLLFIVVFVIVAITFFFIKKNDIYGVRSFSEEPSEEVWHKTHVIVAIGTFPLIAFLIAILFIDDAILKSFLSFIAIIIWVVMSTIVAKVCSKKEVLEKRKLVEEERQAQIKKEQGYK